MHNLKKNSDGIHLVHSQTPSNPTRTQIAKMNEQRDQQRIGYFVRGISERIRPVTPAEKECVRRMAVATWQLKGSDMAERELCRAAASLLRPFKQQAYDDYMSALQRLNALRSQRRKHDHAA